MIRTFVPSWRESEKMRHRAFNMLSLVGALGWAIGIVSVGFLFGGVAFVAAHIELITIAIARGLHHPRDPGGAAPPSGAHTLR